MSLYHRGTEIREIDDALYAEWGAAGNPKASDWQPLPAQPAHDPQTHAVRWDGAQVALPRAYVDERMREIPATKDKLEGRLGTPKRGLLLSRFEFTERVLTTPASPEAGTHIGFKVSASKSSYLRITANTGQKIRLAGGLSASAGYVRSNVAGSFVWLIYDSTDAEWVAWQQGGTWTIDS